MYHIPTVSTFLISLTYQYKKKDYDPAPHIISLMLSVTLPSLSTNLFQNFVLTVQCGGQRSRDARWAINHIQARLYEHFRTIPNIYRSRGGALGVNRSRTGQSERRHSLPQNSDPPVQRVPGFLPRNRVGRS